MTKPKLLPSLCKQMSIVLEMTPEVLFGAERQRDGRELSEGEAQRLTVESSTCRWEFVLHLQKDALPHVLQQTDDLLVTQFGQIDAVHRLDVIAHV